ncbi:hypothetical protein TRICI_000483 [Trichomonascus ciferrii]|uniref:Uncharacterized protein n=1 Tax=Trichomonascus ciferrii TaxID=44093 RepID=A0A642VDA5_9ASCO|nr:hypothetical protein TRICI_000483 [Trichomonascus ciferrii]
MNEPDSDYIQADYLPITPDESTSVSPCVSTSSPHGTGSETSNSSPVESIGYPNSEATPIRSFASRNADFRVYHILVFDLDQNNQELKSLKKEISEILDIAEKVKELYEEDEKTEFNLVMRYTMYSYFPGEDSSSVREMCEDIVQRAIERVKLGQSCDIRSTHLDVFLTEEMSGRKLQDCPITSLKIGKNDVGLNELSTNSLLGVPTNDVDNGRKLRKSTAPRNV